MGGRGDESMSYGSIQIIWGGKGRRKKEGFFVREKIFLDFVFFFSLSVSEN